MSNTPKHIAANKSLALEYSAKLAEMQAAIEAATALATKATEEANAARAESAQAVSRKAARVTPAKAEQDYTGFSKGASELIRACGQRARNDRARLTALVFDAKKIPVADLCKTIGFVSDRHGNRTNEVFNRSDAMRVLRRVQADLLQSAQMFNLYIDVVNGEDKVEYFQLFNRAKTAILPEAPTASEESEKTGTEG